MFSNFYTMPHHLRLNLFLTNRKTQAPFPDMKLTLPGEMNWKSLFWFSFLSLARAYDVMATAYE